MFTYPLSNLVLVTPPSVEPLSLADAKLHLRVDTTADDTLITFLITAAREHVERYTSRALITQTYDYYFGQFPGIRPYPPSESFALPRPPLQSVTSLVFTDTALTDHTWTVSGANLINEAGAINAHVDIVNEPGKIVLAYSQVWPSTVLKTVHGVKVRFTAGYGNSAASIPQAAIAAMKLLIGTWYQNRESVVTGRSITSIPVADGVDLLLSPLKSWNFA